MIRRIVTNGCSWMEGMGVTSQEITGGKLEHRLSALLAKRFTADDINLALPGGSNDRILRTTTDWFAQNKLLNHNETFVLIGLTQIARTETFYNVDDSWARITATQDFYDIDNLKEYFKLKFKWTHTFQNDYERLARNIIAISSICEYYGARYLIFDAFANLNEWESNGLAYHKRSLAEFFRDNTNIYLDESWDEWNREEYYAKGDDGHPNALGNKEWCKHLINYLKKHKIMPI